MITLEEAIDLATKAHKNQWRKSKPLDVETAVLFMEMEEELYPAVLQNGNKVFIKDDSFVMKEPYITHPLAVMAMMSTEEEKITAVLHDVIEDTDWNLYSGARDIDYTKSEAYYKISLTEAIYPHEKNYGYELTKNVYESLVLLTKIKNQKYKKYIKQVTKNKLATKVKLADIAHNLSDNPSEHAKNKYLKAIPILLGAL